MDEVVEVEPEAEDKGYDERRDSEDWCEEGLYGMVTNGIRGGTDLAEWEAEFLLEEMILDQMKSVRNLFESRSDCSWLNTSAQCTESSKTNG